MMLYGVLFEVYGFGVLFIGCSGVGKSECVFDFLSCGYLFVVDDCVMVKCYLNGDFLGYCEELLCYYMELCGFGIVNVKDLFGFVVVCQCKLIDLVVEFEFWQDGIVYECFGFDELFYEIFEVFCLYIKMLIVMGCNLVIFVEIVVCNYVLKFEGYYLVCEFVKVFEYEIELCNVKVQCCCVLEVIFVDCLVDKVLKEVLVGFINKSKDFFGGV